MDPDFEAVTFSSGTRTDGDDLLAVTAHDGLVHVKGDKSSGYGYFDERTASLANIALATTGHKGEIQPAEAQAPTPLQKYLIDGFSNVAGMP